MARRINLAVALTAVALATWSGWARGQAGDQNVSLPCRLETGRDVAWEIQADSVRQVGGAAVFANSASLIINNGVANFGPQARRADGGLVVQSTNLPGWSITRRIAYNRERDYLRIIDVVKNTADREQTAVINLRSSLTAGLQGAKGLADPAIKRSFLVPNPNVLLSLAIVDRQNRGAGQIFAWPGTPWPPAPYVTADANANITNAYLGFTLAPGKESAMMHVHLLATDAAAAEKAIGALRASVLLADVPAALRKLIVNIGHGMDPPGDFSIQRSELFDVVELKSGDRLSGTLQEKSYTLETVYGRIEVPAEKVFGLGQASAFATRQMLLTRDGDAIVGKLTKDSLALLGTDKQLRQIPVAQVRAAAYRVVADEEEWPEDKPCLITASGDRLGIAMPDEDIEVATRYGSLKIKPALVREVRFLEAGQSAHKVVLVDGSVITGLVSSPQIKARPNLTGQEIKFGTSVLRLLRLAPSAPANTGPRLETTCNDLLAGALTGQIKLDTSIQVMQIDAEQIGQLAPVQLAADASQTDVRIVLADQSTIHGRLADDALPMRLACGMVVKVPPALLSGYMNPDPQPAPAVVEMIRSLVAELNADEWSQREAAEAKLVQIRAMAAGTLRKLRADQPPEVRERIDRILAK